MTSSRTQPNAASADSIGARVLAIVGPTAAGKSSASLELAQRTGQPLFACDSVQIYRGLDIGSAKASDAQRKLVRHELIDLVEPDANFSAGDYARAAAAQQAKREGDPPMLLCGGTGLYLRALCWTQSASAPGDLSREAPKRRAFEQKWEEAEAESKGAVWRALQELDPTSAAATHPRNVVRAMRALWLCELHGRPLSEVQAEDPPRLRVDLRCLVLEPAPDALKARISARCDEMMAQGWLGEVEKLLAAGYHRGHKSMRSLGYKQLCAHLEGETTETEAVAAIKRETWAYARRQRTWFRHQLPAERCIHARSFAQLSSVQLGELEAFIAGGASTDTKEARP